jgi:hypothetical protein
MFYTGPSGNETTYYPSPDFEVVQTSSGTDYRHYLSVAGRNVVLISRTTGGVVHVYSMLTDHQGSVSSIVNNQVTSPVNNTYESFTAYGNRREASTWSGSPTTSELNYMNSVTREGYTFQTVLGSMGLNHMNGRTEDAITGRLISADPQGTDTSNTQSFNRYSYVLTDRLQSTRYRTGKRLYRLFELRSISQS